MMFERLSLFAAALSLSALPPTAFAEDVLLFPYFNGNGSSGTMFMYSTDGTNYRLINGGQPIFNGAGHPDGNVLTRDPSIIQGHDGRFYATYTPRFFNQAIGYAVSDDLVNWTTHTHQVWDPADNVINGWAPEVHWDAAENEYLIVFAGTDRNRFPNDPGATGRPYSPFPSENASAGVDPNTGDYLGNSTPAAHRLYKITTTDFNTFTDPELFFDPGMNVIDGQIVFDDRNTAAAGDDRYVMVFKDESIYNNTGAGDNPFSLTGDRDPAKSTRFAESSSMQGVYGNISGVITGPGSPSATYSDWSEGQALVEFKGEWYLFIDPYTDGSITYTVHKQIDNANGISFDPDNWQQINADFPGNSPFAVAHGTPFVIDPRQAGALLALDNRIGNGEFTDLTGTGSADGNGYRNLGTSAPPGWSFGGNADALNAQVNGAGSDYNGQDFLEIYVGPNNPLSGNAVDLNEAILSQTVADLLDGGYQFGFSFVNLDAFGGAEIAGSVVVFDSDGTTVLASYTSDQLSAQEVETGSLVFDSTGDTVTIQFFTASSTTAFSGAGLGEVSLRYAPSAVPEPGSLALIGLAGLLASLRRHRIAGRVDET